MANLSDFQMLKGAAEKLKGKSDEELMKEVKKLRAVMGSDNEKIKKQIESLRPLREMLDDEQKRKFDMVTKTLMED